MKYIHAVDSHSITGNKWHLVIHEFHHYSTSPAKLSKIFEIPGTSTKPHTRGLSA